MTSQESIQVVQAEIRCQSMCSVNAAILSCGRGVDGAIIARHHRPRGGHAEDGPVRSVIAFSKALPRGPGEDVIAALHRLSSRSSLGSRWRLAAPFHLVPVGDYSSDCVPVREVVGLVVLVRINEFLPACARLSRRVVVRVLCPRPRSAKSMLLQECAARCSVPPGRLRVVRDNGCERALQCCRSVSIHARQSLSHLACRGHVFGPLLFTAPFSPLRSSVCPPSAVRV